MPQSTGKSEATRRNSTASCQSIKPPATTICPNPTRLTNNTSCTPARTASASEVMRLMIRPSRVWLKKLIGMRCRWAKMAPRRSWTTASPNSRRKSLAKMEDEVRQGGEGEKSAHSPKQTLGRMPGNGPIDDFPQHPGQQRQLDRSDDHHGQQAVSFAGVRTRVPEDPTDEPQVQRMLFQFAFRILVDAHPSRRRLPPPACRVRAVPSLTGTLPMTSFLQTSRSQTFAALTLSKFCQEQLVRLMISPPRLD